MANVTITQAQLDPLIAAYLAAHPPKQVITQAQVTAGVATYLAAHPPSGGLTVAQVQAMIDAAIAAHVTPPPTPPATVTNRPTNPGAIVYEGGPLSNPTAWGQPGALVIAGRGEFAQPWVTTVANGGGTVIMYLDCVIRCSGRYQEKLFNASEFGAAVPNWPGVTQANDWGPLTDFRPGGVLQQKLPGVLDLIVQENPKIAGIFLDDCGTRSWFPGFSWDAWPSEYKEAYRQGAIDICKTARAVADAHDWFVMVNGDWSAISSTTTGSGGYPNRNQNGCALVDGGYWENHGYDSYGVAYATGQWGQGTPRKLPYMWYANVNDPATRDKWVNAGCAAFASATPYNGSGTPFKAFTDFGLPRRLNN